jgi:hypothetical protein
VDSPTGMVEVKSAALHVTVAVAPPPSLREADFPNLDFKIKDHRIVAEVLRFRETSPACDLAILTMDTGMTLTAKRHNVPVTKVPDDERWRLSEEPDDKDIRIRELEEENAFLRQSFAMASLAIVSGSGKPVNEYPVKLKRFREFTPEELDELIDEALEKRPAIDLTPSTVIQFQFHGYRLNRWDAQRYNDNHNRWVDEMRVALSRLPARLNQRQRTEELKLQIHCCGNRPAEHLTISFKCSGSLLLAKPDRFVSSAEDEIGLPVPPHPSQPLQPPMHIVPPSIRDARGRADQLCFKAVPQGPKARWELDIEKMRHESSTEVPFRFAPDPENDRPDAKLECSILAENFAKSVVAVLTCKREDVPEDPVPIARKLIDELKSQEVPACRLGRRPT